MPFNSSQFNMTSEERWRRRFQPGTARLTIGL